MLRRLRRLLLFVLLPAVPPRVDRAKDRFRGHVRHVHHRVLLELSLALPMLRQGCGAIGAVSRRGEPTDRVLRMRVLLVVRAMPSVARNQQSPSANGRQWWRERATASDHRASPGSGCRNQVNAYALFHHASDRGCRNYRNYRPARGGGRGVLVHRALSRDLSRARELS